MRLAFLILLLGNLAFFVWGQGYLGGRDSGREPLRVENQLQPEKIRLQSETPPKAEAVACKRVSGLTPTETETLHATVSVVAGWTSSITSATPAMEHWVLIPALANIPLAEKKLAEVRQLGFADARIVQDEANGPLVVSMGVFRNVQGAQEFLDTANKKGIRSAKMLERKGPAKTTLEVRAPATDLGKRLDDFLAPYPTVNTSDCEPL
jgi:hypothetical protein